MWCARKMFVSKYVSGGHGEGQKGRPSNYKPEGEVGALSMEELSEWGRTATETSTLRMKKKVRSKRDQEWLARGDGLCV